MLLKDIKPGKSKVKRHKKKPVTDLRRSQLQKMALKLQLDNLDDTQYHKLCNRIVMLQNAHDYRKPIPLAVTINRQTLVYSFSWQTRESVVKYFVSLANSKGITHEHLDEKHREMVNSNYSY